MTDIYHYQLTELDKKILDALQDDARLSSQEIAERVASSASSVWRRVRAMEDAGVIAGYRVFVEPEKLGLNETILVDVSLVRHSAEATAKFIEFVQSSPEILECYVGTGEHDFILKVVARDMRWFFDFLESRMMTLGVIGKTSSTVIMRKIKETSKINSLMLPR
jgi:Lrp/AsnC family transcriptional regulator, leucine-responsive regulatory protein